MHELIREMLHYRNGLGESEPLDAAKVAELENRYDEILKEQKKSTRMSRQMHTTVKDITYT